MGVNASMFLTKHGIILCSEKFQHNHTKKKKHLEVNYQICHE